MPWYYGQMDWFGWLVVVVLSAVVVGSIVAGVVLTRRSRHLEAHPDPAEDQGLGSWPGEGALARNVRIR